MSMTLVDTALSLHKLSVPLLRTGDDRDDVLEIVNWTQVFRAEVRGSDEEPTVAVRAAGFRCTNRCREMALGGTNAEVCAVEPWHRVNKIKDTIEPSHVPTCPRCLARSGWSENPDEARDGAGIDTEELCHALSERLHLDLRHPGAVSSKEGSMGVAVSFAGRRDSWLRVGMADYRRSRGHRIAHSPVRASNGKVHVLAAPQEFIKPKQVEVCPTTDGEVRALDATILDEPVRRTERRRRLPKLDLAGPGVSVEGGRGDLALGEQP